MNLVEMAQRIRKGRFLVIGKDNFDNSLFITGDEKGYEKFAEARGVAICKEKDEARVNGEDNEITAEFCVINSNGAILYKTNRKRGQR